MPIGTPVDLGNNFNTANALPTAVLSTITNAPAGAAVVVYINELANVASPGTVTDSSGNTYTLVSHGFAAGVQSTGVFAIYVATNIVALSSGANITYTKTSSGSAGYRSAFYVTGVSSVGADSAVTAVADGTGTSASVTSGVPAHTNELFLGLLGYPSGGFANTVPSGFTRPPPSSPQSDGFTGGYLQQSGQSAVTYNPTITSSVGWVSIIIALIPTVVVTGTLSSTGSASAAFAGAATKSSPFTALGAANVNWESAATKSSPFSALGAASVSFVGASGSGIFSIQGSASVDFVGIGIPAPAPAPSPTTVQQIMLSYLYQQYYDDGDLQAFVAAYNTMTQQYLDWMNTINLPVYSGLNGALLDWVLQGLYGYGRPTLSFGYKKLVGPLNTQTINTPPPIDGQKVEDIGGTSFVTTDDVYKRCATWHYYKADGKVWSIPWLKRRVKRFLIGTNGVAPLIDNTNEVSVAVSSYAVTVSIPTSDIASVLQAAVASGALELAFQNTFTVDLT